MGKKHKNWIFTLIRWFCLLTRKYVL